MALRRGIVSKNEILLKNLLFQNCMAKVLEILYVALPGSSFPSLFK